MGGLLVTLFALIGLAAVFDSRRRVLAQCRRGSRR